jgi:hypothetical protein
MTEALAHLTRPQPYGIRVRMEEKDGASGVPRVRAAPCPFCQEDLAQLYVGFGTLDAAVRCVRCLAAAVFTANPGDPGHAERLQSVLMEFLPEGASECRMETRSVQLSTQSSGEAPAEPLYLLAAWNTEEWVSPALAARILGITRQQVDAMLTGGELPEAIQGPPPEKRLGRPQWLISRTALLKQRNT